METMKRPASNAERSAGDKARAGLIAFVESKVRAQGFNTDLEQWEFYSFLLAQAKRHRVDTSGYIPAEYRMSLEDEVI
jgi:hypothetical protein